MKKHPNEFTRRRILEYFRVRSLDVDVNMVDGGYVIFLHRFSAIEARNVDDPAGRVIYEPTQDNWELYWMSGRCQWHFYDLFDRLEQALDLMYGEKAANLFHKVL